MTPQFSGSYAVGDFLLVRKHDIPGRVIQWGQRIRYKGEQKQYAQWNHAALIVSTEGDLVEALIRTGATRSHISKYKDIPYVVVKTKAAPLDQQEILRFADKIVGEKYGWLNDLCVFIGYLTGNKLNFGIQNQIMCSGLVARAQERAGAYFSRYAESISPSDLAFYYDLGVVPA